jgi:hypothetical protein
VKEDRTDPIYLYVADEFCQRLQRKANGKESTGIMSQSFGLRGLLSLLLLAGLAGCNPPQELVLGGNLDIGSNGEGFENISVPDAENLAYDAEISLTGKEINAISGSVDVFLVKEADFDSMHVEKAALQGIAEARLTVTSGSSSTGHVSAISSGGHVLVAVAEVGVLDKISGKGKEAVKGVKRVVRDIVYDDTYSRAKNSVQDKVEDVITEKTEFGSLDWQIKLSSGNNQ